MLCLFGTYYVLLVLPNFLTSTVFFLYLLMCYFAGPFQIQNNPFIISNHAEFFCPF